MYVFKFWALTTDFTVVVLPLSVPLAKPGLIAAAVNRAELD